MQGSHPLPQQSSKSGCGGGCGCGSGAVDGVIVGDIYLFCGLGCRDQSSLVEHLDLPTDHSDAGPLRRIASGTGRLIVYVRRSAFAAKYHVLGLQTKMGVWASSWVIIGYRFLHSGSAFAFAGHREKPWQQSRQPPK